MKNPADVSVETSNAQAVGNIDQATGGISPAIHPSTTFLRDENYALFVEGNSYSRDENPTYKVAEAMLCNLEGGADAMLFSSGMAAAMTIVQTLYPGDHIVAPRIMYWGLRHWLRSFCSQYHIGLSFFDPAEPNALERAIVKNTTKLVWLESPCNPTWDILNISESAEIAHSAGAILAVDSTVATPVLTQPIKLGADFVVHSATKYLNGHCDVLAGAIVAAQDNELWQKMREIRLNAGCILGSLEAWLLQRGMRTLFLRMDRVNQSALVIAECFEKHAKVKQVLYPGLPSHPDHDIAKNQMTGGFGGMLSFRIHGGENACLEIVKRCKVFKRATSLGGVESLIEHRYSIEGEGSPVPRDLLRLSIGIESAQDLISDLTHALG